MKKFAFCLMITSSIFAAVISGTVTDSHGMPVSGYNITLLASGGFPPPPPMSAATGADGKYYFEDLAIGTYSINPESPMGVTPPAYSDIAVTSVTDSLDGYDFLLTSTTSDAVVGGTVTYLSGGPATGIEILGLGGMSIYTATTDASGNYEMGIMGGDSTYIMCAPPDGYTADPTMYSISILPGDTILDYDFLLSPSGIDTSFSITAEIFDTTGSYAYDSIMVQCRNILPASPWMVEYTIEGSATFSITESADYMVQPLEPGKYFVPEIDTVSISTISPTVVSSFVMHDSSYLSPYWLHAIATDTTGMPVDSVFIEWKDIDDVSWNPGWTIDGEFSAHVPDSGIYEMRASIGIPGIIVIPAETTLHLTESAPQDSVHFTVRADTSAIAEDKRLQPLDFSLHAHPNPFNSAVTIAVEQTFLSVHDDGQTGMSDLPMQIEIFDVNGRRITVISTERSYEKSPAYPQEISRQARNDSVYKFVWHPDPSLGSGIYLVRATVGGESVSKRVVYLE